MNRTIAVDAVSEVHVKSFSNNLNFPVELCYEIDNGVNTDFFNGRESIESVDPDFFSWKKKYKKIVGYVGGYPLERGASELVLLSEKLKRCDVGILIVGGEKSEVENYSMSKGAGNIWVTGQVDYSVVPSYMSAMDVGVSLLDKSAWGASEQKLRQYLSSGISSVCTTASNAALVDAGVVVPVLSCELDEVFSAIQKAIQFSGDREYVDAIRDYAESNLSVNARLVRRIDIISSRLSAL